MASRTGPLLYLLSFHLIRMGNSPSVADVQLFYHAPVCRLQRSRKQIREKKNRLKRKRGLEKNKGR